MTDAKLNYTTIENELLVVVFAFDKFRSYLVGTKVTIYRDHSVIKYLVTKKDAKPRGIIVFSPYKGIFVVLSHRGIIVILPYRGTFVNFQIEGILPIRPDYDKSYNCSYQFIIHAHIINHCHFGPTSSAGPFSHFRLFGVADIVPFTKPQLKRVHLPLANDPYLPRLRSLNPTLVDTRVANNRFVLEEHNKESAQKGISVNRDDGIRQWKKPIEGEKRRKIKYENSKNLSREFGNGRIPQWEKRMRERKGRNNRTQGTFQ
ncbi:protein NYNRIN-like [Gossypium australe]|uniref:Protein NYNRIN-like n=1 Tax=Gossypium australe TaxID=47621 RepID=A0A5B6VD13_9ROSI|nr:protein NYNRIN-like [Gossypium australe]